MKKFKARQDKILLTMKVEQVTPSGLIIPDEAKSKNVAMVVSVPDSVKDIKVGDKVVFNPFTANEIVVDGESYLIVKDESVYGTLND